MRHPQGVEVFIRPANSDAQFKEYQRPNYEMQVSENKMECYIEVEDDQEFVIQTVIHDEFNFYDASHYRVSRWIDGRNGIVISESKDNRRMQLSHRTYWDGQNWQRGNVCFKVTSIDESLYHSKDELVGIQAHRGSVIVCVDRGKKTILSSPRPWIMEGNKLHDTQLSKQIVKDAGISHTTSAKNSAVVQAPVTRFEFTPSPGWTGAPLEFVFHYRSGFSLQRLGIDIPDHSQPLSSNTTGDTGMVGPEQATDDSSARPKTPDAIIIKEEPIIKREREASPIQNAKRTRTSSPKTSKDIQDLEDEVELAEARRKEIEARIKLRDAKRKREQEQEEQRKKTDDSTIVID